MNKHTKAALLSALVYPGVGQFYLKRHALGSLMFIGFSVVLCIICYDILLQTLQLMDQINNGEVALDLASLIKTISQFILNMYQSIPPFLFFLLIIIWCVSIIDTLRKRP